MASKRDGIVGAAITALGVASVTGTTKPSGLSVTRMAVRPKPGTGLVNIAVYLAAESVTYDATRKTDRSLRFWTECRVSFAEDDTDGDTAIDPLLVWTVKALMLDFTLGGVLIELSEIRTVWEIEEDVTGFAMAAIEWEGIYQTAYNDPESI